MPLPRPPLRARRQIPRHARIRRRHQLPHCIRQPPQNPPRPMVPLPLRLIKSLRRARRIPPADDRSPPLPPHLSIPARRDTPPRIHHPRQLGPLHRQLSRRLPHPLHPRLAQRRHRLRHLHHRASPPRRPANRPRRKKLRNFRRPQPKHRRLLLLVLPQPHVQLLSLGPLHQHRPPPRRRSYEGEFLHLHL